MTGDVRMMLPLGYGEWVRSSAIQSIAMADPFALYCVCKLQDQPGRNLFTGPAAVGV